MTDVPLETTPPAELDKLAKALAAFQAEAPIVAKSHTASVRSEKGSYSYTYADLADVSAAAMPLLSKHGLSFTCLPGPGELVGMLLHSSGQSLSARLPIGGNSPQQLGSSLTYMRRYLFGCMTGIVTDDDDDGQLASKQRTRPTPPPVPPANPPGLTDPPQRRSRPQHPGSKRLPDPPRMPPATIEHPAPDGSVDVPLPEATGQRDAPESVPVAPPEKLAGVKLRGIMAGFRDLGLNGEDRRLLRLAITSALVNRPVESTAELTDPEGSRVLTGLARLKDGTLTYEATEDGEVAVYVASEPPPDQ